MKESWTESPIIRTNISTCPNFTVLCVSRFFSSMRPASDIEIQLGNGFFTFLRRAGMTVVTANMNPALEPDVLGNVKTES